MPIEWNIFDIYDLKNIGQKFNIFRSVWNHFDNFHVNIYQDSFYISKTIDLYKCILIIFR
jgi:hypothetical protein